MDNSIKQISRSPPSNAVTAPTRSNEKAADIERKVWLFGVLEAFREGRYPSNAQAVQALDYALDNSPIEPAKLSKDGQVLIQDLKAIIQTAKRIVEVKNRDELAQNFLFHSRRVASGKGNFNDVNLPVGPDEVKADGEEAVEHLRTLAKIIFTNSEARKLLKDITLLGRDVAADAAEKLAEVARPADHELANVDEPAPSNQWTGPNGERRDANQPVDTGLGAKKEEVQNTFDNLASPAQEHVTAAGDRVAGAANEGQRGDFATDEDRQRAGARAGADQVKEEGQKLTDRLKAIIPDEHKERAKEQYRKAKEYAKDKFPEERREKFIYRLKKVIVESQRHRDYQEAIEFFLDRAETYSNHAQDVAQQGGSQGQQVRTDCAFQLAEDELRTLLERFANGRSMQPIFDAVQQLYTDTNNDEHLRFWFGELDSYIRRVLQEPGYILKDAADKDGRRILDQGKVFWDPNDGKYSGHKDAFFDTIGNFFQAYADDELNVQLGEDVKRLTKDLFLDPKGEIKYKNHLWTDVREVILPALATRVGYIPIPRIEYTDKEVDVVVENLTLESQNLLPNIFEFEARNYWKVSPYDAIKDQSKHSFWVSFGQMQADIKDVSFYVRKKTGFPKLTDSGLADVFIGGQGIHGKIHLESTGRKDHAFNVVDVKVKIEKLSFKLRDNKHKLIIAMFKTLFTNLLRKGIAKAIENGIRSGLVQLDAQLADIQERVEAAIEDEDTSTVEALASAFDFKKSQAQRKKDSVTPAGKFNITANTRDSLVDWSSPHSLVDKITEKEALATQASHEWHSPAFDIRGKTPVPPRAPVTPRPPQPNGSALLSSSIPAPDSIGNNSNGNNGSAEAATLPPVTTSF